MEVTSAISYIEGTAIALMLTMVATMWHFLQRLISTKLRELHEIIIKLIDRSNRESESKDMRHMAVCEKIDELEKTVSGLSERISFLQGRINSSQKVPR